MECKDALPWIHEYLDGSLTEAEALDLKKHLISCPACNQVFKQMEQTEALIKTLPRPKTPDGLTDKIMASLPAEPKRRMNWLQWIKRHPAISVASVFLLVMFSSFMSLWNQDTDLMVKGNHLDRLVIQGDNVYVPAGQTIDGDLMVKRGKVFVDGNVTGNLVVVDGSYNLASTAHISGKITQIDQALDWLWFQVNEFFSSIGK